MTVAALVQQAAPMLPVSLRSLVLITAVLLVAGAIWWLTSRYQRRETQRLLLIEAALRNPSLTPESQRELVQALRPRPRRTAFVIGWLGLFSGIGWLCVEPRGSEFTCAVTWTVLSFALVTLPLALRELEARRA